MGCLYKLNSTHFHLNIEYIINNDLEVALPLAGSSSTWSNWNLQVLVFEERGKLTFEKSLGARERTNNKLNPHMASTPGFEPGPHWWEASVLTTEPPLPYHVIITSVEQLSVELLHMEKHDFLILFPS